MAELNTAGVPDGFGIPGFCVGILHPTFTNRFRVLFGEGRAFDLLTIQVTQVRFNLVKKQFTVSIEQPAKFSQDLLDLIEVLASGPHTVRIEMLDGNEGVLGVLKCLADLVDHDLTLDYAVSDTASHVLTFKYTKAF